MTADAYEKGDGERATSVRYRIVALNFTGAVINYADRAAISVAAPFILKEFGFNAAEWGILLSAFYWSYAPASFGGGVLIDRIGVRKAYSWAMALWSATVPLTAISTGFWSMLAARVVFGAAEGPQVLFNSRITSSWFPRRQMATIFTFGQCGNTLGATLAAPVVVTLALYLGWRPAFFILGAVGFIWTVVWWLNARDSPAEHARVNRAELNFITADHDHRSLSARFVEMASRADQPTSQGMMLSYIMTPYVLSVAVANFAYSWAYFMILSWYPTYLVQARHFTVAEMGGIATIPWLTATVGLLGGGIITDYLTRRTGSLILGRKFLPAFSMIIVTVCFGISPFVASAALGVALVSISMLFLLTCYQYQPLIEAAVPIEMQGSVGGFCQMISSIAGIGAPMVTGFIVYTSGSYNSAFVLGAALSLISGFSVALFVNKKGAEKVASLDRAINVPAT